MGLKWIMLMSRFSEAFNAFDIIDEMQTVDYLKKMQPITAASSLNI